MCLVASIFVKHLMLYSYVNLLKCHHQNERELVSMSTAHRLIHSSQRPHMSEQLSESMYYRGSLQPTTQFTEQPTSIFVGDISLGKFLLKDAIYVNANCCNVDLGGVRVLYALIGYEICALVHAIVDVTISVVAIRAIQAVPAICSWWWRWWLPVLHERLDGKNTGDCFPIQCSWAEHVVNRKLSSLNQRNV